MGYRALVSFSDAISIAMGEVREIQDKNIINDLINVGYIEELKDEKLKDVDKQKISEIKKGVKKKK